ncbi:HAD family phosphatase [uncultured Enorma sp.]|uniref:HAD family hydrolase n=1 Tax=uncultured Enorma sp. TaxID=1714346 RepID=UPI00262D6CE5|nr:HAD-IB family phosphatase [uncultured Enorma sp.]
MKRIVFFDIDGTLTRGATSGAYLANLLGHGRAMEEAEAAYARGEIDNDEVCRIDAAGYAGHSTEELSGMLEDMPLVDGVARAVEAVHAAGGEAHIASLAWGVVAAYLCKRYGFDGYVASELEMEDGVCTGGVALALEGEGKCAYARELCVSRGIDFDACIAIGDSRSDIPLFELVGTSVAFNATGEAERAATHVYRGTDIAEALALAL